MLEWMKELVPIALLLIVVGCVFVRLPQVDVGHDKAYLRRRIQNWLPLGLTYAFLYMGRYNINVSKHIFEQMRDPLGEPLMGNADFGVIFAIGTVVYGFSFLINGPLTDRFGGRKAILLGAGGAAFVNLLMGVATWWLSSHPDSWMVGSFVPMMSALYALNMYFQSFGAVAIVKVNASWFHVRERGVFGAIFGILISLGIYFAYDWGYLIVNNLSLWYVFIIPAILLGIFWLLDVFFVRDTPGETGHPDFDTADASSGDKGPQLGAVAVFKMMLKNPIIMTIAAIEFCSGFLRQAIMQWFKIFAKQTNDALGAMDSFVFDNWGLLLCCAGILGGVIAGIISDHVFQSRRGPVAGCLYGGMLGGAIVLAFVYTTPAVGALVVVMSMCVIGVHGMLSGTASMDFGGKKNVGIAVGIIDGFVYLGTAAMALTYAIILPAEELNEAGEIVGPATNPDNWSAWPLAMIPLAAIGFVLSLRVWNAKPKPKGAAAAH